MVFGLCACGSNDDLNIENFEWKLSVIQSNATGEVLYCSEEMKELYFEAVVLALDCNIEEKNIIFSNGEKSWMISYSEKEKTPESVIFDIEYDEIGHVYIGNAVLGITEYADESIEHTLIISLGDYVLHFTAE